MIGGLGSALEPKRLHIANAARLIETGNFDILLGRVQVARAYGRHIFIQIHSRDLGVYLSGSSNPVVRVCEDVLDALRHRLTSIVALQE